MDITTKTSLVGFLLALSALNMPNAAAITTLTTQPTIEARLSRLSAAIQERASQISDSPFVQRVAIGFADGNGRSWGNTRRGGWADGQGGSWGNVNPWRNGWADGGGFYNYH